MTKFDDILFDLNDFGKYQKIRYFLICIAGLLPSIATYIHSFLAASPDYKCKTFDNLNSTSFDVTIAQKCNYNINGTSFKCTAWEYDKKYYQSTLTEEWNMVCDRSFYKTNVQSIYFTGYLVGSIVLGNLADKFGRRPVMLASFILILVGFIGSAFGPQKIFGFWISYLIYAISRFLIACGTRGINETGYVLALELVGQSKRTYAGIGFEHFFSIGQLVLVLAAYFIRDWRILATTMMVFVIPFLSYALILPESPRWLLARNQKEKALEIIENIAKTNKRKLNYEQWNSFINQSAKKEESKENFLSLIKSLKQYPSQLILILTMFFNWTVNNFVFYGVGLQSNNLGVNPYLSFAISAFVELLAYSTTVFIIDKVGRKKPYFCYLLIAGASCISKTFVDNLVAGVVLAMIGKFAVSASYAILRLYSNEVFPTSIRNSCMGACSMVSRMGVIIAPLIISLGETGWKQLPFLIFGIFATVAAFSTVLLPETLNRNLPENISDAHKLNSYKFCSTKHEIIEKEKEAFNLIQSENSNEKA